MLLISKISIGQLCTGILGNPVVNITFGNGENPGNPLPNGITTYTYTTETNPNDGTYILLNKSLGAFSFAWHDVIEDHTPGDENGYMMIINASETPGVFYNHTLTGLCAGTTHEFSAWILNVLKSSSCGGVGKMPNITFTIEYTTGGIIQSYNTKDIPQTTDPQWKQYGFSFTLPIGVTDIVLRITNNSVGGCGNDLILDDITFRPCGPQVDASFLNVNGGIATANYCVSDSKLVTINSSIKAGYNNPAIQWQESEDGTNWSNIPGATTTDFSNVFSTPGIFKYRIKTAEQGNIDIDECNVKSGPLTIIIDDIPNPKAANSSPACIGNSVQLSAGGGKEYDWTGPNGFSSTISTPTITAAVNTAGKYNVIVKTPGGCVANDFTIVNTSPQPEANAGADVTICEGLATSLKATGGQNYKWTPAYKLSNPIAANTLAAPIATTTYQVKVTNEFNCSAFDAVIINVLKKPIINAGADKTINEGENTQLNGAISADASTFYWAPLQYLGNGNTLSPMVQPPTSTTYTLYGVSDNGCTSEDEVVVHVIGKIAIPNAFSPNNDGINDVWKIKALESYPESTTQVFNRYGQVIFKTKGYTNPWNGTYNSKPLPVGTYYYIIDPKNGKPILSGWVMIVR